LPGNASESQSGITVVLDTTVTPELAAEGLAREVVSRIQNLRKDAGLSVSQRIRLYIEAAGPVADMLKNPELSGLIQRETLASELLSTASASFPAGSSTSQETIDAEAVSIALVASAS